MTKTNTQFFLDRTERVIEFFYIFDGTFMFIMLEFY